MPRILKVILLSLAGLTAATGIFELALRAVQATPLWRVLPVPEVALYGPDPQTGYRHRPNVRGAWVTENRAWIETSALGLRDRQRSAAPGDGPRSIVLGDSLIEAVQVDLADTAVAVAERRLQERRPGAEVVNLGLAGATPPVLAARLQADGIALKPAAAVVVVSAGDFLSASLRDDSAFTAYKPDAAGNVRLSYGFRDTSGYRFRTSGAGAVFYWLLDHSAVARVLNSRKNVGLFAEWPAATPQAVAGTAPDCAETLRKFLALWQDGHPAIARHVVDAFFRDVEAVSLSRKMPIVVAMRGVPVCAAAPAAREAVMAAVAASLARHGLSLVDLDAEIAAKAGAVRPPELFGFGDARGTGHLNRHGNRVYGEIFAETIERILARPTSN